jgi:pilus assembly protein Flp/PilA
LAASFPRTSGLPVALDLPKYEYFRGFGFTVVPRVGVHRLGMIALVRKFWADETAATAIEYGLIGAGISLAIIAVVNGIGAKLNTKFSSINSSLK